MEKDVFDLFHKQWGLVSAGSINQFNCCTVSWGSLGVLWNKRIVTVYIYPSRYTYEFMKENEYFTVCFFPESYKSSLAILGSKSGRDTDKVKIAKLSPIECGNSISYKEAEVTYYCKKIYSGFFDKNLVDDEIKQYYQNNPKSFPLSEDGDWQTHMMFVGEIIEVIKR